MTALNLRPNRPRNGATSSSCAHAVARPQVRSLFVAALLSILVPTSEARAAPAPWCDDYVVPHAEFCPLSCWCHPLDGYGLISCNGVREQYVYCDGRQGEYLEQCRCAADALRLQEYHPEWFDAELWCAYLLSSPYHAPLPDEVCGNAIDEDCDGVAPECPQDSDDCGDGIDNNGDGLVDEECPLPDPPEPQAPPVQAETNPVDEMNDGCQNEDWAGSDPVHLATRSAATEPFTDFEVEPLRRLGITRSYSSADALRSSASPGIFGIGWHHNWEHTLTCSDNGALCTVHGGLSPSMTFAAAGASFVGAGVFAGESLVLYQRTEPANLAFGGQNLMVRRPSGEFVLFLLDGSEQHFFRSASCGAAPCMDADLNGRLPLSRDVDALGRAVTFDFAASGKLITITDDLGNMLSLAPSSICPSRAGALAYRAGPGGLDSTYVTYEYDPTCQLLKKAVPSNYSAAPNHAAQLRAYDYVSISVPGFLNRVRNEFNDPVVVFGYDLSGHVAGMSDRESTLTIDFPQPTQDIVTSEYGEDSTHAVTRYRGSGGKAFRTSSNNGLSLDWDGRYLVCAESQSDLGTRYFERDARNRVVFVGDYGDPGSPNRVGCADSPWLTSPPLRSTSYEYGLSRPIAEGVTLALNIVTRVHRKSILADQLAQAAGNGASPDTFRTSETLDYDPTPKPGDPAAFSCGTSGMPAGGLVCRRIVEGYTIGDSGLPTVQRIGTFYTYDLRGRLVRSVGPVYLAGQAPTASVDPIEERTYWPDDDPDASRRGRLHEVKRWPSGWPAAGSALRTSFDMYDVFGPIKVTDAGGGSTIITRAGGAGRVTRVDYPDGQYIRTRYYDGDQPRLVLLSGGSARRFTYDERGRLHTIEPLSGDPEATGASVVVGWRETRGYDPAGNTTLVSRADAQGLVHWKQSFGHSATGGVTAITHPEPGKGRAHWLRYVGDFPYAHVDEDGQYTRFSGPGPLARIQQVDFMASDGPYDSYAHPIEARWRSVPGQWNYVYEPELDLLKEIRDSTGPARVVAGYVHDDFGHLLSVGAPSTTTTGPFVYTYDARGNAVRRTGGGTVVTYQYDGVDRITRLVAVRTADGASLEYIYTYDDPADRSRLHSIQEPERTTLFTYDDVGRIRFEEVVEAGTAASLASEFRYDVDGDLVEVISPSGLHVKYGRDAVTKDVTEVVNAASGIKYASEVKHLPAGPITVLAFPDGSTLSQGFNARYEPTAITSGPVNLDYEMTPGGNVKSVGSFTYEYVRRRLVRATSNGPATAGTQPAGHTYVFLGDRVTEAWTAGPASQKRLAFGYDDASNLSAISVYDGSGNVTGTTCLVHDALGRLTTVGPARVLATVSGARVCRSEGDLAAVAVRFRYDARNRRVARQDGAGPWKQWVFAPDGSPLAEMWKPTSSTAHWTTEREYVWLEGRPLAQVEHPGPSTDGEGYTYVFHVDHRGQPLALTSTTGAVVWSGAPQGSLAKPYGDVVESAVTDPANGRIVVTNLRLPGQYDERLLSGIGLQGPYYNWNRWYLPELGRYLELDPIARAGGFNGDFGPEWYSYANGNPLSYIDPEGASIYRLAYRIGQRTLHYGRRILRKDVIPFLRKGHDVVARGGEARRLAREYSDSMGGPGRCVRELGPTGDPHYHGSLNDSGTRRAPGHIFVDNDLNSIPLLRFLLDDDGDGHVSTRDIIESLNPLPLPITNGLPPDPSVQQAPPYL